MTTETSLAVIAFAVVVMAVVQVVVALSAAKAARDAAQAIAALRKDMGPILDNARRASEDAARVAALALTNMERMSTFVDTTTAQVAETVELVRDAVMAPIRQGSALLAGLKAALSFFGDRNRRSGSAKDTVPDEDESLFIG